MTAERASVIVKSLLDSISGMIQNIQSYDIYSLNLAHPRIFFLVANFFLAPIIADALNTKIMYNLIDSLTFILINNLFSY